MSDFLDDLKHEHKEFNQGEIDKNDFDNPYNVFRTWYQSAYEKKALEPSAMTLATAENNRPTARVVYLKEVLDQQFVFYTNYNSQKSKAIDKNPHVALLFFWPELERQVRIEGICRKVSESISDDYFASRPRKSQLGAWASNQSEQLKDAEHLKEQLETVTKKFDGQSIPRPKNWGGFYVQPDYFEFWQGRPARLHDRICFAWEHNRWTQFRRNP